MFANGLELNGGTIRNQGTAVNAGLAHGAVTGLPMRTRLVEDIAITSTPRVPATDSGGTPTYGPGEVIEFTVTFGDTVEVTGTPILKGTTSEAGQYDAEYAGGTGSEALRFEWTVPASLPAPAAIWIYSNIIGFGLDTSFGLVLQGATLTDSGGRPVNIRHEDFLSLGTNVDAAPPVLSSDTSGATVDGVRLELIYRRDATSQSADWLDTSSTPAPGDFTVTVDGTAVAVSTVEVANRQTVRLTLSEAVRNDDVVTIDYTPGANPIEDLWGNEAIAVNGRAVRNDTAASTDATLESLTVHDGTSDLTLAFTSGTFAYTAEVDNAVTTVTLTAMTTDDGASVSAVTLDGTAIADTDFTDGITVPSLLVGDNAIAVAVTAENGGTQTYTVTVTRAAATPATVTGVAFTNPPSDGVYDLGDTIEVSVTFSEAVAVTDAPRVRMRLVVSDAYAAYVASASSATVLVFRYTVTGATDDDTNGISVFANGLELNGGTIRNEGTAVDAGLAHGAVTGLPMRTRLVEDIAITSTPRVPATDSGGTPTYGPGEVIEFTVTFGDTVEVTGTPILKGTTSEAGQYDAEYAGGTGSEALRFEWTVPGSLPAPAAIWIYGNIIGGFGLGTTVGLVLQGATLTDSGGRPVNIRHEDVLSLGTNVDAAPPVLSSDTSGATVDGVRLQLIYRRDATSQFADWLDTSSTPAPGDFTVTVDGTAVAVSTVEVANRQTVRLTLSEAVRSGDGVTIDYTPGANPIEDLWGNEAIAVNGRAVRNDTAASTDATLESLTVHDGTSDLTLAPPFASGTFAYTAEVDNAVTTVTLTAMTTDDGASVSAVTLDGTAIADTDFTDGITVPSLLVGDNAIAVTAENGGTQTYTVTVTRADDDTAAPITVSIAANYPSFGAGIEQAIFTLTRTGPTTDELDVTLNLEQEQSWLPDDGLTHTVTFFPGKATVIRTYQSSLDPETSGNLTVTVTGEGITGDSATVEMISIAAPPVTVRYEKSEYTFNEDATDEAIYMVLTVNPVYPRPPTRSVSVIMDSDEDTATYPNDFTGTAKALILGKEDFVLETDRYVARERVRASGDIYFTILDDEVYEGSERLFVKITLLVNSDNDLMQFVYPNGDICSPNSCSPIVRYPVYITDEEDLPVLSLSATPTSISEADDNTTPNITENISVLDVAITNGKTFAKEQTFTLDFTGSAVPGNHYTISPPDTDTTAPGHQATFQANTASAPITITALDNADVDGGHTIEVQGSLDGRTFISGALITIPDDDGTITPATITDVALTNLPSDGVYDLGEIVEVSITFSELVEVTGNPQVGMQVTDFKYADYVASASTAAVLVFHYTMEGTSDDDTDGITVFANGLEAIEGTIRNQGTAVNADLAHERVSGLPTSTRLIESITVTSTPNVPATESGGDATYGPGEVIEFTVTFGDTIDVTGTPILHVDTTEHGQYEAEYTGGSGSTALRFEWTVPATPANYISLSISTNGAGTELIPSSGLDSENATLTDSGNRRVNVRHATVTNLATTDASPPVLSEDGTGATVSGTLLKLIYRRFAGTAEPDWLDMNSTPAPGDFTVTANGTEVTVDAVDVPDTNTVRLTLSQAVNSSDVVTIDYTPGANPIKDLWGNEAVAFDARMVRNDTTTSNDAKLSALTVHDGTSLLTLEPVFAPTTFAYTTDVANAVTTVTLTSETAHAGASITAVTLNATAIADNDFIDGITIPSLLVGENTIVVTVTAEDASTTDTYTVTVMRAAVAAAATITGLAFTNPPSDSVYNLGEIIEVSVTFSEAVDVTGDPRIGIYVSNSTDYATYVASASQAAVLVFRYTVTGARDDDDNGVHVNTNGLELNGGTIRNQGTTVDADLAHGTLQGLPTLTRLVDDLAITSTPRVSAADSGGVPTYGPGEVIEFTVTFADTVDVTGAPILKITTRGDTFEAVYASGTGSDALQFEWTVPASLPDRIAIRLPSNINGTVLYPDRGLVLEGATLTDSGGRTVNVRHAQIDFLTDADATPPVLSSYDSGATVNRARLILTYRTTDTSPDPDWLDDSSPPSPADFMVRANGIRAFTGSVQIVDEETVRITLSQPVQFGAVVEFDYTPGTQPIKDLWGNEAIAVSNRAVRNDTAASSDATLSVLSVNDGTNDLILDPPFVSGTFAYTAEVDNAVTTVTLMAPTTDDRASISAVTLAGTAITDTDFTDGITVPSLLVGDNVIRVTITAENGTTQPYTITVTRGAGTAATVTDVAFTSPPSDGIYNLGELIEVSVTFSEAVDVTGNPRMQVYVFSSTEYATYVASASQTDVLVFGYTVTGTQDNDTNGVHVTTNGLELNGGTIRNQGTTVDADITHDSLQGLPTHTRLVENIAITSTQRVAATQSGSVPTYGPGEVIEFTVTFGDTIDVSGQPILATDTPDGQFEAEYAGGTGSNTLRFEWTVPAALTKRFIIRISANQVVPSQSLPKGLVLQGATLTDSGGRPVNIRHESMQFVAYADATPPALSNQTSGATVALANLTLIYRTSNDSPDPDWLDTTSTPAPGDFTVMVDGTEVAVATVEIVDEVVVRLTLSQPVHSGDVVTIDYTPGANAIKDLWGNEAVAVNNRAVRNDTAASSDATLSALSVNDGTNDLILDPPFVSGTFAYTAEVDNAVTTVTLMAPTTDDRASISAVTLAGTAITDTDFTDGITVPSLLVGDNVIRVTITAENGTTQPYTITVTRGAGTAATVTDVAFTSLPTDGVYVLGDIIEVSVTFSEAVDVTGDPRVGVSVFSSTEYATYVVSASPATVLVFRYTVTGARDDDINGVHVNTNGLELNGGTIRNQGTVVDAVLSHGSVTGLPTRTRLVENIAITSTPQVPAADSGGTPTYGPDEIMEFTVTFGDMVNVTGTPVLKFDTDEDRFDAEYTGGTGSTALQFEWTVPASLPDRSEIQISSNSISGVLVLDRGLVLQGATLTDSGGRPVNIRHEDVLSLGTMVDATPPVLLSYDRGATVNGVRLELIYRVYDVSQNADWLDTSSTPAAGDFTVTVDGTEVAVSTVEVADEETVRLTLSEAVQSDDIVTIDYTPGANPIKDLWGNKAIAVNSRAVRNDTTNTAPVTGVTVTPGNAHLAVSWTAVRNATGYKVQWKSGSQGYNTGDRQATITSGWITRHTIRNLTNGTEYMVRVSATRTGATDGPLPAAVPGTPRVPTDRPTVFIEAVEGTVIEGEPARFRMRLSQPWATTVTVRLDGRETERMVSGNTTVSRTFIRGRGRVEQIVEIATDDDDWREAASELTMRVVPGRGDYTVGETATATVRIEDNDEGVVRTPDVPQRVEAIPGNGQATLVWEPPHSNGGSDITDYEYRARHTSPFEAAGTTGAAGTPDEWVSMDSARSSYVSSYVVSNLDNDAQGQVTVYVFQLRAVNAKGAGDPSREARARPISKYAQRPGSPRHLTAVGNVDGSVTLHWEAPVTDGGSEITHYEYIAEESFRAREGPAVHTTVTWASTGSNEPEVTVSHRNGSGPTSGEVLSGGVTYAFAVRAVNAKGPSPLFSNRAWAAKPAAQTAAQETEETPLTARVEAAPAGHDGETPFTLRLVLSEPVRNSYRAVRDDAFEVTGGTVTRARRVDGRSDLWEVTVAPQGGEAVRIALPGDRACGTPGALCTADGRAVSTPLLLLVPGPARDDVAPDRPAPLTARFATVPGEHDGATAFTVEIVFGEAPSGMKNRTLRNALSVTGGAVTRVRRVNHVRAHRIVTVQPAGHGAVDIALPASPDCEAAGAICTEAGGKLETGLLTRVRGPAALRVADAEVHEGPGAVLAFAVTLDRATSAAVSVDYATSDGTAQAGSDYTAATGSVTFAPGETAKTVSVAVLDDSHDEGSETLTLTLTNPSGAYLADGVATGTIENTDAMPQAWIARFGRTVADQVLDAVDARLRAARTAGMSVSLAGQRLGLAAPESGAETAAVSGAAAESDPKPATLFGGTAADAEETARLKALSDWLKQETGENDRPDGWSRSLTGRELLMGSSFSLAAETEGGGFAGLWGRMAQTRFAGREGVLSLDGDVTTGLLGADYASGRWTTGLVVSHSIGEGGYRGEGSGDIEASVTALTPWAGYAVTERLSVWGAAGYGAGELKLTAGDDPALKTDLGMTLAAAGARGTLIDGDGPKLDAVGDARWVRTTTARVSSSASDGGTLASASAAVTRLRLGLAGWWPLALGEGAFGKGATVTPRLALGVRHDGGDAETGFGADIGGGVALAAPAHGLTVSLEGRGVLTHEAAGLRDRGVAGTLAWNPPPPGRGPRLTLTQTIGAGASGGTEALLSRTTLEGLAATTTTTAAGGGAWRRASATASGCSRAGSR